MSLTVTVGTPQSGNTNSTPLTVTLPGTPQAGDKYVIVGVSKSVSGSTGYPVFASGSGTGWTKDYSGYATTPGTGISFWSKDWESGDPSTQDLENYGNDKWTFVIPYLVRPSTGAVVFSQANYTPGTSSPPQLSESLSSDPSPGELLLAAALNDDKQTAFTSWTHGLSGTTEPYTEDSELSEGSGSSTNWSSASFAHVICGSGITLPSWTTVDIDDTGKSFINGVGVYAESAGTTYQESMSGGITPTGSVSTQIVQTFQESMSGGITPTGSLFVQKVVGFQILHPDADVDAGSWTTAPLYQKVDEDTPSDADYITSDTGVQAATSTCELGFPSVSDPGTFVGWKLRVRARQSVGSNGYLYGYLTDGTTSFSVIATHLTSSFQTFEVTINPTALVSHPTLDYTDLRLQLYGYPDLFANVQVQVSWVELEVPPANPSDVSLASCVLPQGAPGPVAWDGLIWLVAKEIAHPDRLWLFSASSPTEGYSPSDWTCVRLVSSYQGVEVTSAYLAPNQAEDHLGVISLKDGSTEADWYQRIVETTHVADELFNLQGNNLISGSLGYRSNGYAVAGVSKASGSDVAYAFVYDHDGTGFYATSVHVTATIGQTWAMSGISVGDRNHYFVRDATGYEGDLTLNTVRSNNTVNRSSVWTTSEVNVQGVSKAGTSSGLVVAAFRRTDSNGIDAAVFTDADTPSDTSVETVTSRDAYKPEYLTTPVSVVNSVGVPFVLWIDAASDDIYMARRIGTDSWSSYGAVIANGGHSWDTLSAFLISTDTLGVLVSAADEDIYYYELDVSSSSTVSHTVDAIVIDLIAVTHQVDAVLVARVTTSHTVDAYITQPVYMTHTVDAVLLKHQVLSHTVDTYLKTSGMLTHDTDAVLRATETVGHTTDAVVVSRVTSAHTVDATVLLEGVAVGTYDAVLVDRWTPYHTANAVLQMNVASSHTVDAIVGLIAVTHQVDAVLVAHVTTSHTVDAYTTQPVYMTHTVDAFLSKTISLYVYIDELNPTIAGGSSSEPIETQVSPTIQAQTTSTRRDGTNAARTELPGRRIIRRGL